MGKKWEKGGTPSPTANYSLNIPSLFETISLILSPSKANTFQATSITN
jgi:hypothetical protein